MPPKVCQNSQKSGINPGNKHSMVAQRKSSTAQQAAFTLKGNLMTLTVMQLQSADAQAISAQLQITVATSPKFFTNMPVVIDLQHLASLDSPIDFPVIINLLREHGLIPVGVSNGTPDQLSAAQAAGMGQLSQIKKESPKDSPRTPESKEHNQDASTPTKDSPKTSESTEQAQNAQTHSNPSPKISEGTASTQKGRAKVILNPVRSGQQVYAKGDLIILAPVSAGAEILADGNIHVYSTLRGRALAGVQGDKSARIFCSALQAELISIAGHYKLQENIPTQTSPVQIFIEDDQLQIALLQ